MLERLFSLPVLLQALGDAAIVIDDEGRVVYANQAVTTILGYPPDQLVGAGLDRLLPPRYRAVHAQQVREFQGGELHRQIGRRPVLLALAADGSERALTISVSNLDVDGRRYSIALLRDASRLQASLAQAIAQSETDALTGLPNRQPLVRRADEAIAAGRPFGLLFLDLTRFKDFNDTHGHLAGDEVLRIVGARLKAGVRDRDLAARWSGDEFVLLLDGLTASDSLVARARELAAHIAQPFKIGSVEAGVRANIGGVLFPRCGRSLAALIEAADRAMYLAKQSGRTFVAERCAQDDIADGVAGGAGDPPAGPPPAR